MDEWMEWWNDGMEWNGMNGMEWWNGMNEGMD